MQDILVDALAVSRESCHFAIFTAGIADGFVQPHDTNVGRKKEEDENPKISWESDATPLIPSCALKLTRFCHL